MMEKNGRNGGKERLMVERNDSSSSHSSKTVRWPAFIDVTQPEDFGLVGVRNFYLEVEENSRIGVWHIPPADIAASRVDYTQYEQLLGGRRPIFLYLHGTSGTRAGWHRVQLYKLLVSMDFHVITMGYRGSKECNDVTPKIYPKYNIHVPADQMRAT